MTRKDYERIAACIAGALLASTNANAVDAIYDLQKRLTLEMELDSPRFNRDKFQSRITAICHYGE